MALQTSGAISLNDIHVEAGGSSGTTASINDSDIRGLISKASGATMSFNEWYGASGQIDLAMTLNYFSDQDQYGDWIRLLRFRKKAGTSNLGSLVPNTFTMSNGNTMELIWISYSYPAFGVPPDSISIEGYVRDSNNNIILNPANTGWDTMTYVSANDNRTLITKRSEMSYQVNTGTGEFQWYLTNTSGTSSANSTLKFEDANPNDNETGTLQVIV